MKLPHILTLVLGLLPCVVTYADGRLNVLLMNVLKESGFDENTIVLFTSVHGDMLGLHGMRRNRKPDDESASVPGIIRCPKHVPAGRTVDTLFSRVNRAPTFWVSNRSNEECVLLPLPGDCL